MLKRRAAGFLRSDKIAALFTKIGKVYTAAEEVCRKVQEQLQQQADITRSELSHLNPSSGYFKSALDLPWTWEVGTLNDVIFDLLCVEATKWGKSNMDTSMFVFC